MQTSTTLLSFLLFLFISFTFALKPFNNPIIPIKNSPDPGVIFHGGFYYVVTTAGGSDPGKFPIHKSADLQHWELVSYVFPKGHFPKWANPSSAFWAPELHVVNGKFRVYFTAREPQTNILCIGVGSADVITGPYKDRGTPLIKNHTVGSIDATVMAAGSDYYLVWKDDGNGNSPPIPTWIWAQKLTADGLEVTGGKTQLIRNTLAWEANLVEGPWVINRNGYYYLFYSGHSYCDKTYAVGVARSQNPLGPYEKRGDPILKTGGQWSGPGHCSVIEDNKNPGQMVMVYHAWHKEKICGKNHRLLVANYVDWTNDGWPVMKSVNSQREIEEFVKMMKNKH